MSQFQSSPLQQILAAMQANPQIAQLAQNVNPQTLQGIGLLQQYAQQNQQRSFTIISCGSDSDERVVCW